MTEEKKQELRDMAERRKQDIVDAYSELWRASIKCKSLISSTYGLSEDERDVLFNGADSIRKESEDLMTFASRITEELGIITR